MWKACAHDVFRQEVDVWLATTDEALEVFNLGGGCEQYDAFGVADDFLYDFEHGVVIHQCREGVGVDRSVMLQLQGSQRVGVSVVRFGEFEEIILDALWVKFGNAHDVVGNGRVCVLSDAEVTKRA